MMLATVAEPRTSWRQFWRVFPPLAVVPVVILSIYSYVSIRSGFDRIIASEQYAVSRQLEAVSRTLGHIAIDICTLAHQNELRDYVGTGNPSALHLMGLEYLALMQQTRIYDQIRYLDVRGQEVVRVNSNNGVPAIVAAHHLQNKQDRYYFIEANLFDAGEVYFSPLDLNVERGMVETPHRPMIRAATPVVDDQGDRHGIVLINYLAQSMLDGVEAASDGSPGNPLMLNGDGFWLVAPPAGRPWGFMFLDGVRDRMQTVYPDEWARISGEQSGHLRTENGLFTYRAYHPLTETRDCRTDVGPPPREVAADPYRWILATHVPDWHFAAVRQDVIARSVAVGIPMLILLAVGTRAIGVVLAERRCHKARLEALARFDPLTGLANRTTFEDRLKREHDRARRFGRQFGVVYIDLDGFKAVNDTLGHAIGDLVLKDVARMLASICRSTDTPARLGGDEFVILLSEVPDTQAAAEMAKRVIERLGDLGDDARRVGASIGVAVWPEDGSDPTQVVALADKAMYLAKRSGKNAVRTAADLRRRDADARHWSGAVPPLARHGRGPPAWRSSTSGA